MNFLLFGTLWFWVLFVLTSGIIIWLLEDALTTSSDEGGGRGATIAVLIFGVLYYFFGSSQDVINILVFIRDNPITILQYFVGYVLVGVAWAFFKWYFYVNTLRDRAKKRKDDNEYINTIEVPKASYNKYRIMSWMYYWPFSAFWTLINEPLKKSFEYVYGKIAGSFDAISNKMFADLVKENEEKKAAWEKKKQEEYDKRNKKKEVLNKTF